jgi:beta-fructofuranosidase
VTSEALYSGRLVQDRSGAWVMLAFHNVDEEGRFVGEITDPIPVAWDGSGLRLTGVPAGWRPD